MTALPSLAPVHTRPRERRRVRTFPIDSGAEPLEQWLNNLPGRLFMLMPHPSNGHVWMAVTVEET